MFDYNVSLCCAYNVSSRRNWKVLKELLLKYQKVDIPILLKVD